MGRARRVCQNAGLDLRNAPYLQRGGGLAMESRRGDGGARAGSASGTPELRLCEPPGPTRD